MGYGKKIFQEAMDQYVRLHPADGLRHKIGITVGIRENCQAHGRAPPELPGIYCLRRG